MNEAIKYYANILTPFSALLKRKLDEIMGMDLAIDMIATSHGVIWRDDPMQIVERYAAWADDYQEDRIIIVYDTMWNGTRTLARRIAEGIELESPDTVVKTYNLAKSDMNDLVTEVFRSKAVVVGSPTVANSVLHSVAGFLHYLQSMKFKQKKAAAFGCYGWSGEAVKIIEEHLEQGGFELAADGLRHQWNPDDEARSEAVAFGRRIARA